MHIPWEDVRLLLMIAEHGSLSRAASVLGVGQPTVSRRLAELEGRLGEKLFRRSVDGATPTRAAERLLPAARRMAEWAGEVDRAAAKRGDELAGLVRVTAPPAVAYELLTPFAAAVAAAHPSIRVEVASSTRLLDLARGEADLALRARPPATPDLVQVASVHHANKVFVARARAARLPADATLASLPWIAWAPPFEHLTPNPELEAAIPGFVPRFTADDFLVQLRACELGLGAMVLADYDAADREQRGLVPLPLELGAHAAGVMYLVAPRSALEIPRVRRVADLLVARLERDGGRRRTPLRARGAAARPTSETHPVASDRSGGPRRPRGGKGS